MTWTNLLRKYHTPNLCCMISPLNYMRWDMRNASYKICQTCLNTFFDNYKKEHDQDEF